MVLTSGMASLCDCDEVAAGVDGPSSSMAEV